MAASILSEEEELPERHCDAEHTPHEADAGGDAVHGVGLLHQFFSPMANSW
jgi:hypothetical protein